MLSGHLQDIHCLLSVQFWCPSCSFASEQIGKVWSDIVMGDQTVFEVLEAIDGPMDIRPCPANCPGCSPSGCV